MAKTVDDLRDVLFATIEGVRDKSLPLDRAQAVANLGQVIINSSKIEVEFIRATNGRAVATGFLGKQLPGNPETEPETVETVETHVPAETGTDTANKTATGTVEKLPGGVTRHIIDK